MVKNNEVQRQSLNHFLKQFGVLLLSTKKIRVKLNKFSLKNLLETHHPGILLNLIFTINNFKH